MDLTSPIAVRKRNFIRSIYYDVEQISKESGIPIKLVLAMAAAETGWGEDFLFEGSNNIFNIKAFSNHKGKKTAKKDVLEYKDDGTPYAESSSFRIYDSYVESIEDLIKLLKTDRYSKVRSAKSLEDKAKELLDAGYAKNDRYAKLLTDIFSESRLKDALKGLPTRDELEEKLLEKICNELEYETTLRGYRGIPIKRSELSRVLDSYSVCVCHKGEKVGELTKKNPELKAKFLVDVTYYPGKWISKGKYYPDYLKVGYRSDGVSSSVHEAWWSIDKKKFVDSAPAMKQFSFMDGVHTPIYGEDSFLPSCP